MKKAFLFLMLAFPALALAHSAMNRFWGEVPVDMLLTGDVLVVRTLTVPEDVTLTVDPGTVVRFEGSKGGDNRIVVKGALIAVGSEGRPVRFVPKDKGSGRWYGIEFMGKGHGRVEHCVIEGATAGIKDPGGKVRVADVLFR